MNSIRRRLLQWQISALIITALMVSGITYTLAWNAFNRLRDYSLEQIAYSILRHGVVSEQDENGEDRDDHGQFVSQIWDDHGALVFTSTEGTGPPPQANGAHVIEWLGEEWHTYTLRSGGLTIQVGNPSTHRSAMFARTIRWLLLPGGMLVALLGGLIWIAVGRALAPLEQVRKEIGRRDIATLHALRLEGLPDEIVPLVETLNDLLARLDAAVANQRRFVADAAHELRTPLTAVRLQAQLASQVGTPAERQAALDSLLSGVDRATHLVDQLLSMARLEPDFLKASIVSLELDVLVKRVVADFSAQADARRIDLGVVKAEPGRYSGHAESLRMMLGNLLDNALRYTPAGGRVDLGLRFEGNQAVLTVSDTGPGIPAGERERVFDRFHRLPGNEAPGSGLGLALARQAAELHGGRISLHEAPGGGLLVRVELPLSPDQAAGPSGSTG